MVISHSRAATEYAEAIRSELAGLDSDFTVGLAGPPAAGDGGGVVRPPADECLRPLILVVCVDSDYARDPALLGRFREHVRQRKPVIPLILPGYAALAAYFFSA